MLRLRVQPPPERGRLPRVGRDYRHDAFALGTHWLTDADSGDWFPPPLPVHTIAAIHRHLVASAN